MKFSERADSIRFESLFWLTFPRRLVSGGEVEEKGRNLRQGNNCFFGICFRGKKVEKKPFAYSSSMAWINVPLIIGFDLNIWWIPIKTAFRFPPAKRWGISREMRREGRIYKTFRLEFNKKEESFWFQPASLFTWLRQNFSPNFSMSWWIWNIVLFVRVLNDSHRTRSKPQSAHKKSHVAALAWTQSSKR